MSVAGLSPQVISETLYGLVARPEPIPVREIRVVTTRLGAERVRRTLLHPRTGWFHRFCRDFGIPRGRIRFDEASLLVPRRADGTPLEDVRTAEDNALVADCLLALIQDLARDPAVSLHCSVAGGRKTMGLLLGAAFQLCARPGDVLSHVLVWPPELEGHPGFFYPPRRATRYRVGGKTIAGTEARVELAEIPVLLLRDRLRAPELAGRAYSELIAEAQRELDRLLMPPGLRLEASARRLWIGGQGVSLTPLEFALYRLFAVRRAEGCGDAACGGCPRCGVEITEFLDPKAVAELAEALRALGARDERARTLAGWQGKGNDPRERFLQVRSRINQKIRRALGAGEWVGRYCLVTVRVPGSPARYCLPLPPDRIALR